MPSLAYSDDLFFLFYNVQASLEFCSFEYSRFMIGYKPYNPSFRFRLELVLDLIYEMAFVTELGTSGLEKAALSGDLEFFDRSN